MAKKQPTEKKSTIVNGPVDDPSMIPSANFVRHVLGKFLEALEDHDLDAMPYRIPLCECEGVLILAKLSFERTHRRRYDLQRLF